MLTAPNTLEIQIGDFHGHAEGTLAICALVIITTMVLIVVAFLVAGKGRRHNPPAPRLSLPDDTKTCELDHIAHARAQLTTPKSASP